MRSLPTVLTRGRDRLPPPLHPQRKRGRPTKAAAAATTAAAQAKSSGTTPKSGSDEKEDEPPHQRRRLNKAAAVTTRAARAKTAREAVTAEDLNAAANLGRGRREKRPLDKLKLIQS